MQAAYQVLQQESSAAEMELYQPQQQSVNNEFLFKWQAVAGAALYKLSIMELQGNDQWFVTGILLPQNQTQTSLTELMQQKLKQGALYRWQVNAINDQGQILASSKQATFTYQP